MRKKILFVLIGLIAGIGIFINYEDLNPIYIGLVATILAAIFFVIDKRLIVLPVAMVLGFGLSSYKLNSYKLKDAGLVTGFVTISEKRQLDEGYRYLVDVDAEGISEKSVMYMDQPYEIGDMFYGIIDPTIPNKNTNPNLFNYRNYLISKNIASTVEIKSLYKESVSKSKLLAIKGRFYNYIHDLFELNLSPNAADFAISVVLAENIIQNDDIKDLGLAHILAVSGLHIDMLIALILFIFRKLGLNYKIAYITSLVLCVFYGFLIGFPYSVIRVLIINTIGFMAFLLKYPEDKIKSLMIAALVIILANPFAILNAGFVLTFVAASGVYLIWPKIRAYLRPGLLGESLGFTTSIQMTLLPFSVYYYGKVNLISILANFIIVPIFTVAMHLIFGLIFLYPILRGLAYPFFKILDYLLYSILNISGLMAKFSLLSFEFAAPNILIVLYFYILILVAFYIKKANRNLIKRFYGISLLIVAISIGYDISHPELSFAMIDIGQGDAFLLNDEGDYYLFDVGGPKYRSYDSGERILIPYLKSLGIREIEAVFISHEDKDHSGNLAGLCREFKVKNVITTKHNMTGLKPFNPRQINLGEEVKLKNGKVTCIYEGEFGEENAESMGLIIEIRGIKILTLGDLGKDYEDKLDIKADILKVSHHGSRSSTSRAFVEKVSPKLALISAGRNNTYGHPTKEVIENLDGVKIYNSQDNGMVKIYFEDTVRIEPFIQGGFFK